MKFYNPKKDYPYTERMLELNRVKEIPYEPIKLKSLKKFEKEEISLLRNRPNFLIRSQALASAQSAIRTYEEPVVCEGNEVDPILKYLACRVLF